MMPDEPAIVVRNLVKTFGDESPVEALRDVSLTVRRGEHVALMGTSGSGKSTLLHLLAGLDVPTSGSIRIGGVELSELDEDGRALLRRRQIGLVFQSFHLLDVLSAGENVALALTIAGCRSTQARRRANDALAEVGLAHRAAHLPAQLSGGEQQRVAIARALAIEPLVLLADEPTGNLDSRQGRAILRLLRQLVDRHGLTLVVVTHDAAHAALADRRLRLRDGRLVERREAS